MMYSEDNNNNGGNDGGGGAGASTQPGLHPALTEVHPGHGEVHLLLPLVGDGQVTDS